LLVVPYGQGENSGRGSTDGTDYNNRKEGEGMEDMKRVNVDGEEYVIVPICPMTGYLKSYTEGKTEEEILAALTENNNRLAAGEVSDVLYPCFYCYGPDMDQWIEDLKITVGYIKKYYPQKKIVGYIWPQYYDWKTSPYYMQFIAEEKFLQMLEAAYEHLDGVVIWAHGRDADNKTKVNWEDDRVQAIYRAIKTFAGRHNLSSQQ
jgi:hypothetical protein